MPGDATSRIPFNDPGPAHAELRQQFMEAFARVLGHGEFVLGREVRAFEEAWARFTGAREVVACSNGTDAIALALRALGVGAGDEVVAPTFTFIATIEAIVAVGATPVLTDVDPASGLMTAAELERVATARTRAVIPVHLFGQLAPMEELLAVARARNLACVEDAAQAHGSRLAGRHAGTWGEAGTFSFYPGKNLGALGDAGAVVTDDSAVAARLRRLRDHGRTAKYLHECFAASMRMDGLQGALLSIKLPQLERWNANRERCAAIYRRELAGVSEELQLPPAAPAGARFVPHLFVLRHPRRDAIIEALAREGVEARSHYATPCHLQAAWLSSYPAPRLSFPGAESIAASNFALPLSGTLAAESAEEVARRLKRMLGKL